MKKTINKKKRNNFIPWDDYFMAIALLSAQRSKDPDTQVGACIVNPEKKIIGIGYNGLPTGCDDDEFPWNRTGSFLETKYAYVCHAEVNAIVNSLEKNLHKCSIYTVLFPCNECAKIIIQSRICEVIYLSDKYADKNSTKASKKMLNKSKINFRKIRLKQNKLYLNMDI